MKTKEERMKRRDEMAAIYIITGYKCPQDSDQALVVTWVEKAYKQGFDAASEMDREELAAKDALISDLEAKLETHRVDVMKLMDYLEIFLDSYPIARPVYNACKQTLLKIHAHGNKQGEG